MEKLKCSSCKQEVANEKGATKFLCPNCGKHQIARCRHCRVIAARYACPGCGFSGPN